MRTITSPSDIERLFKHGKRASHPLLVLLVSPSPEGRDPRGRVMFVAGRKMGNAVVRNRCKRVLREATRRAGGPWEGRDVALMARTGIATASPAEIDSALEPLLARLGVKV
ncbi:MAG: ribonuclease P protein component [Coriobacteriia bacterium]|nr:ribonuclease P protein component [Coriobacteriia bacterium]